MIVDNGDTLINCLAYIDLNPVRAGMVEKPEQYVLQAVSYPKCINLNQQAVITYQRIAERIGLETAEVVIDREDRR